jgi:hypothetical protein
MLCFPNSTKTSRFKPNDESQLDDALDHVPLLNHPWELTLMMLLHWPHRKIAFLLSNDLMNLANHMEYT